MPSRSPSANASANQTSSEDQAGARQRRGGIFERVKSSAKEATNALMQQRLKSWQPVMTPKWIIISFGTIGFLFVALGGVLLGFSESVVELSKQYDDTIAVGASGFLEIPITKAMTAPVFLYYELTNFYQNHRRYVSSRDDDQLAAGDSVSTGADAYSKNCEPWYQSTYYDSSETATKYQYYPCGLVARSVFNDTFTVSVVRSDSTTRESLTADERPGTISWPQDVNVKFNQADPTKVTTDGKTLLETMDMWLLKTFPPQVCLPNDRSVAPVLHKVATRKLSSGMEVVDCDFSTKTCNFDPPCTGDHSAVENKAGYGIDNSHFINWMRTAGLSTFRKLYARIDSDLSAGDKVYIGVQSNFEVQSYQGTKLVVLSTATWMGGKNAFLGISYIVIGGLSLLFTAAFAWLHFKNPRRLIDVDYLDWTGSQ